MGRRAVSTGRSGALAAEFSCFELSARPCDKTDGLIRPDMAGVDLAVGQDHDDARADAHRDDARRRGARALERPAPEDFEVRGRAPRTGKAGVDERREMPALADDQRELGALRLPLGTKAR